MTIFVLINEQDTDSFWGSHVDVYLDNTSAIAAMKKRYEDVLRDWGFDTSLNTDEHYAEIKDNEAIICDGTNTEHWRIEEKELSVEVAVEVGGGLVQNIYANTDVYPEVYDLDVSDFPDEGEETEHDRAARELEELIHSPNWRRVF